MCPEIIIFTTCTTTFFSAGGGSRKGSRSNTPTIVEEVVVEHTSPKPQKEEEEAQNAGDTQRTQPTVIEPVDQELPGFNIDDFLGDIIGYPSEFFFGRHWFDVEVCLQLIHLTSIT